MEEIWKDIVGFEGHYQISNFGNVKSLERVEISGNLIRKRNAKILIGGSMCRGYLGVTLCKSNIKHTKLIHRLVAIHFIENPDNKEQVNHKDGNKINNHIDNLEWVTNEENSDHAVRNGLYLHPRKEILQFDLFGNYITQHKSILHASKDTGITYCVIHRMLTNKVKRSKCKFVFKFKN